MSAVNNSINGHTVQTIIEACQRVCVDAWLIHRPPDNPEPMLEEVQNGLLPNLEKHGQLVDVILYPHPDLPGQYFAADGNYRVFCLGLLKRKVWGRVLPKAPTQEELITLRFAITTGCKKVDLGQLGCDVFTWMNLAPGRTERDAADHFCRHPSYINKLVSPLKNGIPELVEALKARRIAPTAAPFVASLSHEQQREALPKVLGKKRAAVKVICDGYKTPKPKQAGKPFKIKIGGLTIMGREPVAAKLHEMFKGLHGHLGDALKQVEKNPALANALLHLLAG